MSLSDFKINAPSISKRKGSIKHRRNEISSKFYRNSLSAWNITANKKYFSEDYKYRVSEPPHIACNNNFHGHLNDLKIQQKNYNLSFL